MGMQPRADRIAIDDNEDRIVEFLAELLVDPRLRLIEWSKVTKQTPNLRVGYPSQHLASLISGVEGGRSGARGDDLADGSEVKSCSRIDQLDKCRNCGAAVARLEEICPSCGSSSIKRNNDSKWLFTIHTEVELTTLVAGIDRVLLLIGDHPNFDSGDYATLRFQAFELWPKSDRARHFRSIMEGYYRNIYLSHIRERPEKTPAPKNFWPYSFQFFMCNPVKTFQATVTDSLTDPRIQVDLYVDPFADREPLPSELMPTSLLQAEEVEQLSALADSDLAPLLTSGHSPAEFRSNTRFRDAVGLLRPLDEAARRHLSLRQTDVPVSQTGIYRRRSLTTE